MSRKPGDLIVKDPSADEPQGFDWTAYLLELGVGVALQTSTWSIVGTDGALTQHDAAVILGTSIKTQVYLAGGTYGGRYTVTNHIVTDSAPPVTDERSFEVLVQDR